MGGVRLKRYPCASAVSARPTFGQSCLGRVWRGGRGGRFAYLPIDYTVDGRNPAPIDMETEYHRISHFQNGSLWGGGGEFGAKIFLNHWYLQSFAAIKALYKAVI